MKKQGVKKRREVLLIIANLIISIIAIAFMISMESGVVSGQSTNYPTLTSQEREKILNSLKDGDKTWYDSGYGLRLSSEGIWEGYNKATDKSINYNIGDSYIEKVLGITVAGVTGEIVSSTAPLPSKTKSLAGSFKDGDTKIINGNTWTRNNGFWTTPSKPKTKFNDDAIKAGFAGKGDGGRGPSSTNTPTETDPERPELEKLRLKGNTDKFKSRLKTSATYAGIGLTAGQIIKEIGGDKPWSTALGNSLQAAGLAAGASNLFAESTFFGGNAPFIGLGVGVIVFILTYKKVEYETVFFTCKSWEAPIGGNDCEKCNDGVHPCSEYRCKSLGQACELIEENIGTDRELCVWKNPKDVKSPAIRPLQGVLTEGFIYVPLASRPPNWGTKIKPFDEECIPPFTPIQFGIETDKPSQCKIDFLILGGAGDVDIEPKGYDEMRYDFGNSNLYDYNHTQTLSLPSPSTINRIGELNTNTTGGLEIRNNGQYSLYVRCRSANGYYNADPYAINFCVEDGPDLTPPIIEETSIRDGQPVNFKVDNLTISVFTNEPSNCRWARDNDLSFEEMTNNLVCANNLEDIRANNFYECRTTLTGIKDRQENLFYFRCEDQPYEEASKRNRMQSGKQLKIIGTQELNIKENSVIPKQGETLSGSTNTVTVQLGLETLNGYKNGEATCLYSLDNETFIRFFETGTHLHKQKQDLVGGSYTYYYKCIDLGGNLAETSTSFDVFIDKQAPRVVRVLNDANRLKIITDEDAICRYSNDENIKCNFNINEDQGTPMQYIQSDNKKEHLALWDLTKNYYIKCMDSGSSQPATTECSIIVRPVELGE